MTKFKGIMETGPAQEGYQHLLDVHWHNDGWHYYVNLGDGRAAALVDIAGKKETTDYQRVIDKQKLNAVQLAIEGNFIPDPVEQDCHLVFTYDSDTNQITLGKLHFDHVHAAGECPDLA